MGPKAHSCVWGAKTIPSGLIYRRAADARTSEQVTLQPESCFTRFFFTLKFNKHYFVLVVALVALSNPRGAVSVCVMSIWHLHSLFFLNIAVNVLRISLSLSNVYNAHLPLVSIVWMIMCVLQKHTLRMNKVEH